MHFSWLSAMALKLFFLSTKYTLWSISCLLTFDCTYFKDFYEVFFFEDDQVLEKIGLMEIKIEIFPAIVTTPSPSSFCSFHTFLPPMVFLPFVGLKTQLVLTQVTLK